MQIKARLAAGGAALAVTAALVSVTGAAATTRTATKTKCTHPTTTVTIAGTTSGAYLPVYIGIAKGYYSSRCIDAQLLNTSLINASLLSGSAQLGLQSPDGPIASAAQGAPLPAIMLM